MKIKFIISALLVAFVFTACQDCKDCQSTADITLTKEFFVTDIDGNYVLDSTKVHSYTAIGRFVTPIIKDDSLALYTTPVSIMELCGSDLTDATGESMVFEQTLGDSTTGFYKYSWTETWDCK
jgi:hypothetical protein